MKTPALARLVIYCTALLLTGPLHAQIEGTLFTRPEERNYLDELREQFVRDNAESGFDIEVVEIPELPADEVATVDTSPVEVSFGGIMTRRDGSRSVWVNGRLLSEQELPSGMGLVTGERSASLRITHDGAMFLLRPGQSVNLSTGAIEENLQRPPPEPAPAVPQEPATNPATTTPVAATENADTNTQATPADGAAVAETAVDQAAEPPPSTESISALADSVSRLSDEELTELDDELERRQGTEETNAP